MRIALALLLAAGLLAFPSSSFAASHQSTNKLTCSGAKYEYRLFAIPGSQPQPAILLLHGAGDEAENFIQPWIKFAKQDGIVLIVPQLSRDPKFEDVAIPVFRCIVADAEQKASIDSSRVYVFGHSAGGYLAYDTATLDSQFYAAVAVHGMLIGDDYYSIVEKATRKTPIAIYIGDHDQYSSVKNVERTRDWLLKNGFPVHYVLLPGHDHNYYAISDKINTDAWDFLSQYRLPQ
jgi:predicted esterase